MKTTLTATMAALLLCAGVAQAQGYVGLSGGATNLKADCAGTLSCDNNGTGFKVFGGYKFTPALAAELVYLDFGKAKAAVAFGSSVINAEIKTSGIGGGIAVGGNLAPNVPATARLGIARIKATSSGSLGSLSVSESDNTTQAYFGFDVGYAFSKSVAVTVGADFSRSENSGDAGNVRMIGVGLTFSF